MQGGGRACKGTRDVQDFNSMCDALFLQKEKKEIRRKQQNVVLLKLNCEYTACKLSVCLTVFIVCELEGERGKEGRQREGHN